MVEDLIQVFIFSNLLMEFIHILIQDFVSTKRTLGGGGGGGKETRLKRKGFHKLLLSLQELPKVGLATGSMLPGGGGEG